MIVNPWDSNVSRKRRNVFLLRVYVVKKRPENIIKMLPKMLALRGGKPGREKNMELRMYDLNGLESILY